MTQRNIPYVVGSITFSPSRPERERPWAGALGGEICAPFQPHSDTSRAAAQQIDPRLNALHRQVYEYIAAQGLYGATDEAIASGLPMNPSTARPRRLELCAMGRIRACGYRKTKSGRLARVWIAAPL
jgi:hypothetical protein